MFFDEWWRHVLVHLKKYDLIGILDLTFYFLFVLFRSQSFLFDNLLHFPWEHHGTCHAGLIRF